MTVTGVIIIVLFLLLCFLEVPIAFSMIISAMLYVIVTNAVPLNFVPQGVLSGSASYLMLSIPYFLLVGEIMNAGGITRRIFTFALNLVGVMRGGLAQVNVVSQMIFAGMSGSAVADAAGIGKVGIKAMKDNGYTPEFSVGLTASASLLGPLIPPSASLVLYAIISHTSIGSMFLGGLQIGVFLGIVFMITILILSYKSTFPKTRWNGLKILWKSFLDAFWALLAPIILVGGILSGLFTPTESSIIAVLYSFFVAIFVYKDFKIRDIPQVVFRSLDSIGMVMLIIAASTIFSWMLGMEQIDLLVSDMITGIWDNTIFVFLMINILLLIGGMLIDTFPLIMILTPVLLPIAQQVGIDPISFGIIMIFNLMIGCLTPPVAIVTIVAAKVGNVSFKQALRGQMPFVYSMLIVLVLINIFHKQLLWLPNLFIK